MHRYFGERRTQPHHDSTVTEAWTMMITFEKKTKKKHSSYVENIYIYLSFAGTKNIIAKSMKNTCTLFNHKVFHQKANSQS